MTHLLLALLLLGVAPSVPEGADVDRVLEALDARGDDLKTLQADVTQMDTNAAFGDAFTRTGRFTLAMEQPPRVHIVLDKKIVGRKIYNQRLEYLLADGVLIERTYDTRTEVRRELPQDQSEPLDMFKLGEGPFPLPIGQSPDEVKRQFEVTLVPPASGDPPGTTHLTLLPHPSAPLADKFLVVDVWVRNADAMPVRIETVDVNEEMIRTTELTNVKLNAQLPADAFQLPRVEGWQRVDEPMR